MNNPPLIASLTTDPLLIACWLTLDETEPCPPHNGQTNPDQFVRDLIAKTSMPKVIGNWEILFKKAQAVSDVEFSQNISRDANVILASAKEPLQDNVSPREVLLMIQKFLTVAGARKLENTPENKEKAELIKSVKSQITEALALIEGNTLTVIGQQNRVKQLGEVFNIRLGLQFFNERITNLILWDIIERVSESSQNSSDILIAAGGDIRERLNASGNSNLEMVKDDLNNARVISQRNLEAFRKFLAPSFGRTIKDLANKAKLESGPLVNRPNQQSLAKLCTLVLTTGPDWPSEIPWSACKNTILKSINSKKQGPEINLNRLVVETYRQPLQTRFCTYHRYLRESRLQEVLKKKEPVIP